MSDSLRFIPLSYSHADSRASALRLILALRPDWKQFQESIEFVRFTEGITNTLLKAVYKLPGLSPQEVDRDAILLRAYGNGTDLLIDRERETRAHALLASYGLAPPLFARFENGLLYKFIEGDPCSPADMRKPDISKGIAWRLGEWHARLPISKIATVTNGSAVSLSISSRAPRAGISNSAGRPPSGRAVDEVVPNLWTILQKWINVLPAKTEADRQRRENLQREYYWVIGEFGGATGVDGRPFVFSHCDLLSGNVIRQPTTSPAGKNSPNGTVTAAAATSRGSKPEEGMSMVDFIDYEYSTAAPAFFDLANHFAEWAGFECEYGAVPTKSQRRAFLTTYLRSYNQHIGNNNNNNGPRSPGTGQQANGGTAANKNVRHGTAAAAAHGRNHSRKLSSPSETAGYSVDQLDALLAEVDRWRGIPGFYWSVWALVQATVSHIDFDYTSYAEQRIGEYWAWKRVAEGKKGGKLGDAGVRERRWAEE